MSKSCKMRGQNGPNAESNVLWFDMSSSSVFNTCCNLPFRWEWVLRSAHLGQRWPMLVEVTRFKSVEYFGENHPGFRIRWSINFYGGYGQSPISIEIWVSDGWNLELILQHIQFSPVETLFLPVSSQSSYIIILCKGKSTGIGIAVRWRITTQCGVNVESFCCKAP